MTRTEKGSLASLTKAGFFEGHQAEDDVNRRGLFFNIARELKRSFCILCSFVNHQKTPFGVFCDGVVE